ncbi:hypothetical protein C8J57DRAFT_472549 [Mycena rebaudengoi]|nr:hypothetical protein C8J57DRAFT_472549 [Mycena rebaudengoi]
MRPYNGLPLDDDIIDRIMTFCPTFGTLQSTILVSKAFYRVFQAHPKSITRAVAYIAVGPALPQALRVVRYPYYEYDTPDCDSSLMATACPEDHSPSFISAEENVSLQENSRVVATLEDIYSLTNKDHKTKTSVLTSDESWRFRRAMYRIMLYCNQFPGNRYTAEEIDFDDEELIEKIRAQRTTVLSEYSTDELHQLDSVVKFLHGILDSVSAPPGETLLSTGPSGVQRAWQAHSCDVLEDDIDFAFFEDDGDIPLFQGYFSLPLENIWAARKITPPNEDDPASQWILDQVDGANDTCSQCAAAAGIHLYTEANWDRFPIYLTNLLKNNLKHNATITQPFFTATSHLVNSDALGPFIGNLFALKTHTAPAFDNWERTHSYCFGCLTKFLEEHLWIWFLEERVRGGWTPPENCWHGWGCRTQVHNQRHADRKNHLCVPKKGGPS